MATGSKLDAVWQEENPLRPLYCLKANLSDPFTFPRGSIKSCLLHIFTWGERYLDKWHTRVIASYKKRKKKALAVKQFPLSAVCKRLIVLLGLQIQLASHESNMSLIRAQAVIRHILMQLLFFGASPQKKSVRNNWIWIRQMSRTHPDRKKKHFK